MAHPLLGWTVAIALLMPVAAVGQARPGQRPAKARPRAVAPAPAPSATVAPTPVEAQAPVAAPPTLKPRLAVLGIDGGELSEELRAGAEDVMSQGVRELAGIEVVTAADLRAVLQLGQLQQLMGCGDERCVVQAGELLAVQQLVSGTVRVTEEAYVISVQRVDLVNRRGLGQQTVTTAKEPAALLDGVRRAVPPLFGVVGRIVLWDQPTDAEVFVNGRLIGRTPVEPVVVKDAGRQEISVLGPGLIPWSERIELAPGGETRLRVRADSITALEADAVARRRLGVGLATGGGALALLAGGLYYLAYDNDRRLDNLDWRTTSQAKLDAITGRTLGLVVSAVAAALLGLGAGGTGAYLLVDNPAADRLRAHGLAAP